MATDKQIAANKRNAARSTGPRTSLGKARSRLNALRHGLSGLGQTEATASHGMPAAEAAEALHKIRSTRAQILADVDSKLGSQDIRSIERLLKRAAALTRYEARVYAARKRAAAKRQHE